MLTHNTPLPLPVCSSASSVARCLDLQHCVWPSPVATNHQVPRAPLPADGVTVRGKASCALSGGVTPLSSLVWTHATDQIPPSDFVDLFRPVLAGCCQPLLEDGPSRRYLRSLCEDAWTFTPSRSDDSSHLGALPYRLVHVHRQTPAASQSRQTRHAEKIPAIATSTEGVFRGCSHSLMFRLLHLLGPQVAPTAVLGTGQPGRLHHAMPLPLPPEAVISLRNRNGKTDTAGLAPARLRPCRPLPDSRPRSVAARPC